MWSNFFKVAVRNLLKNRMYSFINIAGLTLGMTCFILIALYIQYEMSYDQHFENADQIYRVYMKQEGNNFRGTDEFTVTPMPLAQALKDEFPEIEQTGILSASGTLVYHENDVFSERGLALDADAFELFQFPILEGAGKMALEDINAVLITETLAKKYFGSEPAIGKTLTFNDDQLMTVKGILKDPPKNQHLQYSYIASLHNLPYYNDDIGRWNSNNYRTYVKLPKGYNYRELEAKMDPVNKQALADYEDGFMLPYFKLQPITDIHLYSQKNIEMQANSDIRYIYLFATIAFIILLLASINYMNLATANSAKRAKEVGIRKVIGAQKGQLVYQMLCESFLLTIASFSMALALVNTILPLFNQLLDQQIPFDIIGNQWLLVSMLGMALLIGSLSGLYPALFLSAVSPVKAFKGSFLKDYRKGSSLRNILVVGQFAAGIILAISSVVVYQQLQYIQNKKLGYNRDQVIYVPYRQGSDFKKIPALETELKKNPNITHVSFASNLPLNSFNQGIIDNWEGNVDKKELWIYRNNVGNEYFDLFEMEIVEGRSFSAEHPTDTIDAYVLNESAVKALGWESPLGKQFRGGKVIGVVKDFHFQPFNFAIEPMYLRSQNFAYYGYGSIIMKLQGEQTEETLAHVESTFKSIVPQMPYRHFFYDDTYKGLYESEQRIGQAFNIFTLVTLLIACMGLFGLVSHQVLQRTKEIGIRKVLGASVGQIVELLSRDFIRLVTVALAIAIPVAWLMMRYWLQSFVYRIIIPWWVYLVVGFFAIGIAFLTISLQSIKAALANPVKALRSE